MGLRLYMNFNRQPWINAWADYIPLLMTGIDGLINDWIGGSNDYLATTTMTTSRTDSTTRPGLSKAMATTGALANDVVAFSASVGDERYPYETANGHRLCHNNGPTGGLFNGRWVGNWEETPPVRLVPHEARRRQPPTRSRRSSTASP